MNVRPPRRRRDRLAWLRRAARLLSALLLASLLASCSAVRTGYEQLPTLSYWWLDSYFDFTGEQAAQIRRDLREIQQWHRATQLPAYADLLASVGDRTLADGDAAGTCEDMRKGLAQIDVLGEHLTPYLARWARQLKPAQLARLRRELAEKNAEWREEWLDIPAADLAQKRYENWLERADRFYDDISDEQKRFMQQAVARSAFDPNLSWQQRLARQQDMLDALTRIIDARVDEDGARSEIAALIDKTLHPPERDYRAMLDTLVSETCANLAGLHQLASLRQRQHARDKLAGYERDLRILSRR